MEEGNGLFGYQSKVSSATLVERKLSPQDDHHLASPADAIDLSWKADKQVLKLDDPSTDTEGNSIQESEPSSDSEDRASTPGVLEGHTSIYVDDSLSGVFGQAVYDLTDHHNSIADFVHSLIQADQENASFLVTNLANIVAQFQQWKRELPMVQPFYAVKCNPDPSIVRLLAKLGCSFDCATMGEIDLVLHGLGDELSFAPRGIAGSSIVYANPAKMLHMLQFAADHGVRMTVFDGEDELIKISQVPGHEHFQLLLRLTTDDHASMCRFSKKFGCPVAEAPQLLEIAKSLGLNVAGVSFHVGSGCGDPMAYVTALEHASVVFEAAAKLGMKPMHIVDLGGGFPGGLGGDGGEGRPSFQALAAAIRQGIDMLTSRVPTPEEPLRFIAEPGRYFVSSSTTIVTKVYSRKGGHSDHQALYVDDGVYGSFNNVVYDHALPVPVKLKTAITDGVQGEPRIPTAVFGPTCDGLDQMCSLDNTLLERCEVGDWLIWSEQGAYTHTASFVFNGYTHIPKKHYCYLPV